MPAPAAAPAATLTGAVPDSVVRHAPGVPPRASRQR